MTGQVQASTPKSRQLLTAASAAALLVALGAVLWLGTRQPSASSCRLPDGSVLTLEAITYGPQEVVRGSGLQRLLYAVLPAQTKQSSGCRVYRSGAPDVLAFHILRRGGTAEILDVSPT